MRNAKKQLIIILSVLAVFFFLSSAYMWGKLQGMSQEYSVKMESISERINLAREKAAHIRNEVSNQLEQVRINTSEESEIVYDATAAILKIDPGTVETTVQVEFRIRSYVYAQKVTILVAGPDGEFEVEVVPDLDRVSVELTIPHRGTTGISCRIEPSTGDVIRVIDISPEEMLKERFTVSSGNNGALGSSDEDSDIYEWHSDANPKIRNEYGNDERLKLTECVLRFEFGEHIQEYDLMDYLVDENGVQIFRKEDNYYTFSFTGSEGSSLGGDVYIIARDGYGMEFIFN